MRSAEEQPTELATVHDGWVEADDQGLRRVSDDHTTRWSIDPGVLVSSIAAPSNLGKALQYFTNHKVALGRFLDYGTTASW